MLEGAARVGGLVGRGVVRGALAAHLGGVLLFTLLVVVERTSLPTSELVSAIRNEVPGAWARAAGVLGLVGVTIAVSRMRRLGMVLGLGTLGVDARVLLLVGAIVGAGAGALAARVPVETAEVGGWERGEGGWIRDGEGYPDEPGGLVRRRVSAERPILVEATNGALAGGLGAALGLWAGAPATLVAGAVLLVGDVVGRGLVERGALPMVARLAPAAIALVWTGILLMRAPLFPRRWR